MSGYDRLQRQLVDVLRQHLAGGKPVVPEAGRLLWGFFVEISASRTYHAAGPHPISFAEIEAYCRLHRWPLQPHHVDTLRAMDNSWLDHAYAKKGNGQKAVSGLPTGREHTINASAFDAVFG